MIVKKNQDTAQASATLLLAGFFDSGCNNPC